MSEPTPPTTLEQAEAVLRSTQETHRSDAGTICTMRSATKVYAPGWGSVVSTRYLDCALDLGHAGVEHYDVTEGYPRTTFTNGVMLDGGRPGRCVECEEQWPCVAAQVAEAGLALLASVGWTSRG